MPLPQRISFTNDNDQWLQWGPLVRGLEYASGSTILVTDAVVTGKLYRDRVIGNDQYPGELVTVFGTAGTVALVYANSGIYRGLIANTFTTTAGRNYVLVVDAASVTVGTSRWELRAAVTERNN